MASEFLRARYGGDAELILVDDGSRPNQALTEADLPPGAILRTHPQNIGKGGAVRTGMLSARGAYLVTTDSDLPFSLEPIPTTLRWLEEGADLVIGDRLLPESTCETEVTALRRLSSFVFTFMVNHLVGLPLPDTQCGYKGYRAAVARALFEPLDITTFAFDVEILARAQRAGYRLRRQPLSLVHNEDTSVRLSRHAPQMIKDTLRVAWRSRRGRYG